MLTKTDCLSLLVKIEDKGIPVDSALMKQLIVSKDVPLNVLQFIAANMGIEATNFYEMLRRKHNKNKSPLYVNILQETLNTTELITTLSCLLTQIILYGRKLDVTAIDSFYKEVRAEEITRALNTFFKTGSTEESKILLALIKADLLVLEYVAGKRDLKLE